MKITYLAQDVDAVSGIGRVFSALASGMAARGHDVSVICQRSALTVPHTVRLPGLASVHAVDKLLFRYGERALAPRHRRGLVHSAGVGHRADVVSAGSCHRAAVEIQRALPASRLHHRNLGLFDRISLADEHRLMTASTTKAILAVSRLVRDQLLHWYDLPPDKVVVIPNGIDVAKYTGPLDREVTRVMYGLEERAFTIGFLGNEFDRKGVQTIIEALPLLRDLPLRAVIAGGDDPGPYMRMAAELRVDGSIHWTGRIDRPESFLRVLDLFVFPVHYEPFGMVVPESMAAGVPVITTRTVGAVEDLKEGEEVLLLDDPHSASELAGQIRRVFASNDLRIRLAAAGKLASGRFAWPSIIDRVEAVYDGILGSTP